MPTKFDHVAVAIEESKNLNQLAFHELMGSLEAHEKRLSRFNNMPLKQAIQSNLNEGENKSLKAEEDKGKSTTHRRGHFAGK